MVKYPQPPIFDNETKTAIDKIISLYDTIIKIGCMSPKPEVKRKRKTNALNAVADDKVLKTRTKKC